MSDPLYDPDHDPALYRPCAGVMLLDRDGRVFVGQRLDNVVEAWQMPQGGIDPDEDVLAAALRELGEETGITPDLVSLVAEAPGWFHYDLPADLAQRIWKGRWKGQRQRWFLFRFNGTDADVDIATPHPEFRAWRWVDAATLPDLIVPFKRDLYRAVLAAFAPYLSTASAGPMDAAGG